MGYRIMFIIEMINNFIKISIFFTLSYIMLKNDQTYSKNFAV